ncbi:hypothetical protein [Bacillus thuringiensis]
MDISKIEKIAVASSILSTFGEDALAPHVDLNRLSELCEESTRNSTARQCGEATISVLNKIIDSLSEKMQGNEEGMKHSLVTTINNNSKTSAVDQNVERILVRTDKLAIEGDNK